MAVPKERTPKAPLRAGHIVAVKMGPERSRPLNPNQYTTFAPLGCKASGLANALLKRKVAHDSKLTLRGQRHARAAATTNRGILMEKILNNIVALSYILPMLWWRRSNTYPTRSTQPIGRTRRRAKQFSRQARLRPNLAAGHEKEDNLTCHYVNFGAHPTLAGAPKLHSYHHMSTNMRVARMPFGTQAC